MKKRLLAIFTILTIATGALAGTPLHVGGNGDHDRKCCKKAMSGDNSPEAAAARLCCSTDCSEPVPNSGIINRADLTPVQILKTDTIDHQKLGVFDRHFIPARSPRDFSFQLFRRTLQPFHIRFHSILI